MIFISEQTAWCYPSFESDVMDNRYDASDLDTWLNKWEQELPVFMNLDGILADLTEEVAI